MFRRIRDWLLFVIGGTIHSFPDWKRTYCLDVGGYSINYNLEQWVGRKVKEIPNNKGFLKLAEEHEMQRTNAESR